MCKPKIQKKKTKKTKNKKQKQKKQKNRIEEESTLNCKEGISTYKSIIQIFCYLVFIFFIYFFITY